MQEENQPAIYTPQTQNQGKRIITWLCIVSILLIGATGYGVYFWQQRRVDELSGSHKTSNSAEQKVDTMNSNHTLKASAIGIGFDYPADWDIVNVSSNSIKLQSPGFSMSDAKHQITSGSELSVTAMPLDQQALNRDTETELVDEAKVQANGAVDSQDFINVTNIKAIKFTHHYLLNKHLVVAFIKDGKLYVIDQKYPLSADNPYQSLMKDILNTLKLQ